MDIKAGVPIIGAPKLLGATIVVLFLCTCEAKQPMQGLAGNVSVCPTCKTKWKLDGKLEINVAMVGTAANES